MPLIGRIAAATARGYGLFANIVQAAVDPYFNYVVALLPGNGTNGAQNNTFLDSSTNAFSITRNGNTTQGTFSPFSQTGWSNYFDGTGDYLRASNNAAFDFGTGDITFEAWVFVVAYPAVYASIVGQDQNNNQAGTSVGLGMSSSGQAQWYASASSGSYTVAITGGVVPRNVWAHLAGVRNGNTWTLYINGTASGTATSSVTITQGSAPYGGLTVSGLPGYNDYYFTGYISNARVVKGTAVYTSNFTPPTAPLTAISGTSLLTCQSNRFIDNSSNAFAITRNGDVSVQAFSPFNPTAAWSAATNGGSGYFDGSGDYLSVPASSAFDFGSGAFTLEAWVYLSTVANNASVLLPSSYSGGNGDWILRVGSGGLAGKWEFTTWWGGTGYTASSNDNAVAGTWTHLAAVRNGNTFTLYVNGVAQTTTATNTNTVGFSARTTLICGDNSSGVLLTGYVSSARIVKGTAVYTAGFTPPTSPLTAITNTSLLLNFTNAGIYDATSKNDLETVGNAQISTTQSKFGGSSMYFDGTGDYLVSPDNPSWAFGSGDFTIEFWYNPSTLPAFHVIIEQGASDQNRWIVYWSSTTGMSFDVAVSGSAIIACRQGSTTGWATGNWYHVAITRYGNTFTIYRNGVSVATATDSDSVPDYAGNLFVAGSSFGSDVAMTGYLQDIRLTRGIARYTSNFTPPTTAFLTQ